MSGGLGWSVEVRNFANLGNRRDWLLSLPGHFTHRQRGSDTHLIGEWVCRRDGFDKVLTIKISAHIGNRTPIPWSFSPEPDDTDWTIAAPYTMQFTKIMLQSTLTSLTGTKKLISVRNCACVFAVRGDLQSSVSNTSYLAIFVQRLCNPCSFCGQITYL